MKLRLSVIIPTLLKTRKLSNLLRSLEQQIVEESFEVFVINNSTSNSTRSFDYIPSQKSPYQLHYIKTQKTGVNFARNLGMQRAQSEILLFIDDDCWIRDQHLIAKHILLHQQHDEIFALGGYYHLPDERSLFDICYHRIQMNWLQAGVDTDSSQSQYLIGGHFSVKSKLASQDNIEFDECITYGGSELGFFKKSLLAGLQCRLHDLYIIHDTSENLFSLTRKLYLQGIGKSVSQNLYNENFIESASAQHDDPPLLLKFLNFYLNLIFWLGYFKDRRDWNGFLKYMFKSLSSFFSQKKGQLIQRVDRALESKKNRGDLL